MSSNGIMENIRTIAGTETTLESREGESGEEDSFELNLEMNKEDLRVSEDELVVESELDSVEHGATMKIREH